MLSCLCKLVQFICNEYKNRIKKKVVKKTLAILKFIFIAIFLAGILLVEMNAIFNV